MWKLLVEGLASPAAVLCCWKDGACPGGDWTGAWCCWDFCQCGHRGMASQEAVQDFADVDELSSSVTELLWELIDLASVFGWLLILLAKPSGQHCQATIWWFSSGDGSCSGDECHWLFVSCSSQGFGCCSTGTGAELSTARGLPGVNGPGRSRATGPSMLHAGMSLDSSPCSLARARAQFAPYGRGWPLHGWLHFEHPGTCERGCKWHRFHVLEAGGLCRWLAHKSPGNLYGWCYY